MRIKNFKLNELKLKEVKKYIQNAYKEEKKRPLVSYDTITFDFIEYAFNTVKKSKNKGVEFILSKSITLRVNK